MLYVPVFVFLVAKLESPYCNLMCPYKKINFAEFYITCPGLIAPLFAKRLCQLMTLLRQLYFLTSDLPDASGDVCSIVRLLSRQIRDSAAIEFE